MDRAEIEALARRTRVLLWPGIADDTALPLERVRKPILLETTTGPTLTLIRPTTSFPFQIWALTTFAPAEAFVWLNGEAWPELRAKVPRTRFSVAHELGHVVMHRHEVEGLHARAELEHTTAMEREANAFAAELLMPRSAFARLGADELRVDRLALRFGVSAPMAARRVNEALKM